MLPIFKLLTPKVLKAIMDYVFEDNNLDQQMAAMQKRVAKLEKVTPTAKEMSVCGHCQKRIMEKAKDSAGLTH